MRRSWPEWGPAVLPCSDGEEDHPAKWQERREGVTLETRVATRGLGRVSTSGGRLLPRKLPIQGFFFFLFLFRLFRTTPAAYGGSQARA